MRFTGHLSVQRSHILRSSGSGIRPLGIYEVNYYNENNNFTSPIVIPDSEDGDLIVLCISSDGSFPYNDGQLQTVYGFTRHLYANSNGQYSLYSKTLDGDGGTSMTAFGTNNSDTSTLIFSVGAGSLDVVGTVRDEGGSPIGPVAAVTAGAGDMVLGIFWQNASSVTPNFIGATETYTDVTTFTSSTISAVTGAGYYITKSSGTSSTVDMATVDTSSGGRAQGVQVAISQV